jgi:hypothetical protein
MARNLTNTSAPALPFAPTAYSREYQDILNNILRIYLLSVDNAVNNLLSGAGGQYLAAPYGAFQDLTTQTTTANTAKAITFNTLDYANGVSLGTTGVPSTSRVYVEYPGIYNVQWSGQFVNTDSQLQDASVWVRINGSDFPGTTGYISVPNKHGAFDGHAINAWNYFLQLNAGDYVELWWSATSTQVAIKTYPVGVTPARPSTASAIITVSFVSRLP